MEKKPLEQVPDYEFRTGFSKAVSARANEFWDTDLEFAGALNITSTQSILRLQEFNEAGIAKIAKDLYRPKLAKRIVAELQGVYSTLKAAEAAPQSL